MTECSRHPPVHNPAVTGSHPVPATCFDGSEIWLPSGYTKGQRRETLAFSRSIASYGNGLRPRRSLEVPLSAVARDAAPAPALPGRRIFGENSRPSRSLRGLGYRLLRVLNRSQPLHGSRFACGRDLRHFVAPKLAGCSPEGEPLHLVIHGRLDCLPFGSKI